jgi:hypothetical protein
MSKFFNNAVNSRGDSFRHRQTDEESRSDEEIPKISLFSLKSAKQKNLNKQQLKRRTSNKKVQKTGSFQQRTSGSRIGIMKKQNSAPDLLVHEDEVEPEVLYNTRKLSQI